MRGSLLERILNRGFALLGRLVFGRGLRCAWCGEPPKTGAVHYTEFDWRTRQEVERVVCCRCFDGADARPRPA